MPSVDSIEAPLLAAAGPEGSAYALLPADGDGRVRRIDTRLGAQSGEVPTLAGELARRAGAAVNSGLIGFSRPLAIDPVSMGQVLAWARDGQGTRLRRLFAGYVSPDVMDELEAGRLEGMSSQRLSP